MNCRDLERLMLSSAGAPLAPEAAAHAAACDRCRPLVQAMEKAPDIAPPSMNGLHRIQDELMANLKPVRPLPPSRVLAIGLLGVLLLAAAGVAASGAAAGWLVLGWWQRIPVLASLGAGAALLAFSLVRQSVPGGRLILAPYVLLASVGGVMAVILAVLFEPRTEPAFVHAGLVCLGIGLATAIPAANLFRWILRRTTILNPGPAGATAGALAGWTGLLVLEVHCPNLNQRHILVWHEGVVLVSAVGGFLIANLGKWKHRRDRGGL